MANPESRACLRCEVEKPLEEFHHLGKGKFGRRSICKACRKTQSREYQKRTKNRDQRKYLLKKTFGITLEQYDQMLRSQAGVCAICGRAEDSGGERIVRKNLSIDHSHDTGRLRGLLCTACNLLIGRLEKSLHILPAIRAYFLAHESRDIKTWFDDPVR